MGKRVIVIGAGAAGMMAAGKAAERGLKVTLLEKNDRVGKKIRITGKGRCNITNTAGIDEIIDNTPGNGHFLYSSLYNFSNIDLINFFESYGLKTKIERGGRVFPESDKALDVVNSLMEYIRKNRVELMFDSPVKSLITEKQNITGVALKSGKVLECDAAILATGGSSYPGTGSTGDGYAIAAELGHSIVELKPSLVPLVAEESWIKEVQGLSLRNVSITMTDSQGKKLYEDFGEMLFTHFGVSGPVILSGSRHILNRSYRDVTLNIDLKPALNEEKLDERVQRDFQTYSKKQFKNALDDLLPQKLIPVIIQLSGISPDKFVNQITREERTRLVKILKRLQLTISGSRPIKEAIVTAGGVATDEINPSTMESKIVKGLYFAGEVIDVDAYTGGFNLTIAFSTGYLAGSSC